MSSEARCPTTEWSREHSPCKNLTFSNNLELLRQEWLCLLFGVRIFFRPSIC